MEKKVFPIQNASACVYKWGWNTFRLYNGKSSSCHRVTPVAVSLENFKDFHNTPEVIQDRQLMLAGEWPQGRGCEYCKNIEDAGGVSDRIQHNQETGQTPWDFNTTSHSVTPRILELYLNNTCDLACVYCIPIYSSKINDEIKRFGPMPVINIPQINRSPDHATYLNLMLEWMEENAKHLQRLSIQGGEPFLQKEFDVMLTWLEQHSHPELELSFNTNLNENPGIVERVVERVKKMLIERRIKRVDFNCSIDCWGERQEFIRYGLKLTNWQRNFEYLMQHRWLKIHTGHTVTSLSIKTLPDLLETLNRYRTQGLQLEQTFGSVDGKNQEVMDPCIFGGNFYQEDLSRCFDLLPPGLDRDRFEGIATAIAKSNMDRSRLSKLYVTLNEFDRRRQTDWKSLFPEIHQFFIENEIQDVV